jgi:osmotically-inducible protein OsmY
MAEVYKARILLAAAISLFSSFAANPANAQRTAKNSPQAEDKYPDNLSREIHRKLNALPYYSVFDNLAFAVQGNKVTLTGSVVRPTLKTEAEQTVRDLTGVGAVLSQIEVLPVSTADDDLRRALYRAIYEDKSLERYGVPTQPMIHIIVKNGDVNLEGAVESAADKSEASAKAQSVANVHHVRNNLAVREKQSSNK